MRESNRQITGQALKFGGLLLMVGGSLAMLRTRGVENGFFDGLPLFFLLLIPAGLVAWVVGFRLCLTDPARAAPQAPGRQNTEAKPRG